MPNAQVDRHLSVAVVYPIPFSADGAMGGGERFALELTKALARRCNASLVTIGTRATLVDESGARIESFPCVWRPQANNPLSFGFLRSLRHADVIHCTSYSTLLTDEATLWGRLRGKKVFITDIGGGGSTTLSRVVDISRVATGFLSLSQYAASKFAGKRAAFATIGGGVDTALFRPGRGKRQGVVFVGRLLPHKGIDRLIPAVPADTPLTIIGRPMHADYYAHLVRLSAGRDVRFLTDANDETIAEELRRAALAVQPTAYRDYYGNINSTQEFFGLSLAEAMASGTPVICSRLGAHPELVEDGVTGLLVEPDEQNGLADAVVHLLSQPKIASAMGEAVRQRIEKDFTWDAVAARCLDAYAGRSASPGERAA